MSAQMQELVRLATLAANGHNAQPWKFAIKENVIEIHPDYTRRLPVVDPNNRALWISLGCALENLLVGARAAGFAWKVTYPEEDDLIRVRLTEETPDAAPLYDAIEIRQCTRSEYNGRPVDSEALDQLQDLALEPGVSLRFLVSPTEMGTVEDYVSRGNLSQYANKAFLAELIEWLRFNKKEALAWRDGLDSASSGSPRVPRWLGKFFVSRINPQKQANADSRKLRSSSGVVVVASESDTKSDWVRTGQVCERMTLTMTSLGIKSAFLNQPIEVPELRLQFQDVMGLGESLPQLLVRFGYGNAMPRSQRRPVEEVLLRL